VSGIGLYWTDVLDWAEELVHNPQAQRDTDHPDPQMKEEKHKRGQNFGVAYQEYVVRDCLKPAPKQAGLKRRFTNDIETDPARRRKHTPATLKSPSGAEPQSKQVKPAQELAALHTWTWKEHARQGQGKFTEQGQVKRCSRCHFHSSQGELMVTLNGIVASLTRRLSP
jgi:hypothetical protein